VLGVGTISEGTGESRWMVRIKLQAVQIDPPMYRISVPGSKHSHLTILERGPRHGLFGRRGV
jgi:hypothetical protein